MLPYPSICGVKVVDVVKLGKVDPAAISTALGLGDVVGDGVGDPSLADHPRAALTEVVALAVLHGGHQLLREGAVLAGGHLQGEVQWEWHSQRNFTW